MLVTSGRFTGPYTWRVARRAKGYCRVRYRKDGSWVATIRLTWVEQRLVAMQRMPRLMPPDMARAFAKVAARVALARLLLTRVLDLVTQTPSPWLALRHVENDRPPEEPVDTLLFAAPNAPGI